MTRLHKAAAPLVSIITVTRNAAGHLARTAISLRQQRYSGYEWIVIDGASTDDTVAVARQFEPDRVVSEPDQGIYDAMNKGLRLACGEWIYFLNAGDVLFDAATLDYVVEHLIADGHADVVFGNVIYFDADKEWRREFHWLTPQNLLFGDLCHQAVFARRAAFEQVGFFDSSLRFNADFDWLLRVARRGRGFKYMPVMVAKFAYGGAHILAGEAHLHERDCVRARYVSRAKWRFGNWLLRCELKVRRYLGQAV